LAIFASLTDEPYLLSIDQIGDLTDYQIWRIYGKDRDANGRAKPIPGSFGSSQRETHLVDEKAQFLNMGLALGIRLEELETSWRAKHGGRC
jgi:hypothetical protein